MIYCTVYSLTFKNQNTIQCTKQTLMSINCKNNNRSFPNFFSNFISIAFLLYISSGDTFLQNPDDVNVIVRNDCNHTFVGFSDKVCLSDAEKLPTLDY